jgi:hypothetical protein
MPAKQEQRAEINTFVQGLITEASPLNFPPNAEIAGENFELNRDGSRNRRLGMDIEPEGIFRDTGISDSELETVGITSFRWTEVAGNPNLEFLVLQFNNRLDFYDLNKSNLSRDGFLGSVTISAFPDNTRYSLSSVEGVLVVVSGIDSFAVVSYESGSFSYYLDRIKIRDLFGVQEAIPQYEDDMTYQGPLNIEHYYNLQNQSWGIPRRAKTATSEHFADPVAAYMQTYGAAPSNGESVWIGMQFTPGQYNGQTQNMDDPYETMFTKLFVESRGSEVKTARGYYIIDALRRGQSRVEQMNINKGKYPEININPVTGQSLVPSFSLPSDFTTGGPTCIAEFAGRMFFSGFTGVVVGGDKRSPNFTNYVFFSTLVKNKLDLGRCYQDGDPTGRETADILDTDGGFLRISEAKNIHSLVNLGTSLVVIADNGVWRIDGGSDYGFSATNYRVEKISSFGGISSSSVVVENDRLYYWAEDGIYTVGKNEFGDPTVSSISVSTIQTFYEEIPSLSKARATSIYDNITKKVRWVFNSTNLLSEKNITKELILDTTTGSFTVNRIMNLDPNDINVYSLFQTSPYVTGTMEEPIYVGSEPVNADSELVVGLITSVSSAIQATKYLAVRKIGTKIYYSFSLYGNVRFKDWESIDSEGADAKAFCLTGHQIVGDSAVRKQIPYLIMHFKRTEKEVDGNFVPMNQSGCLIRCQWNFANTINSKNWTPLVQAYRYKKALLATEPFGDYDNGYEVVTTKNKIRGSGKAFALYFETQEEKDCRILGWNITMTGNSIT